MDVQEKLANLSCPFTWGMEKILNGVRSLLSKRQCDFDEESDDRNEVLLIVLMHSIMMVYEHTKNHDFLKAEEKLKESEVILETCIHGNDDVQQNSIQAVLHIVKATKCHVLHEMKKDKEMEAVLKEIKPVIDMDKREQGTLYGCQSVAWSEYHLIGSEEAIKMAKLAIQEDKNNGIWYYILAKNLRRLRRISSLALMPTVEEMTSFKKAFDASKKPLFGIYTAQMYRENKEITEAINTYEKIKSLNPDSCKIQLRLALGFIRTRRASSRARECLDYVATQMPENSTYLHYRGIYLEKCEKKLQDALEYYKQATDHHNYAACISYIICKRKLERHYNPTEYLREMLNEFKDFEKCINQINLHLGMCFYFIEHNRKAAFQFYYEAIKINPQDKGLECYINILDNRRSINVYEFLAKEVRCVLADKRNKYEDETFELCKNIEKACKRYGDMKRESIEEKLKILSLN